MVQIPRRPISNWIICISGYRQTQGNAEQGVPWLAHRLITEYGHLARVEFYTWDSDWSGIAEWIFRASQNGSPPTIMLVAYSWGVGYGALRLLHELRRRGVRVNIVVLSDGVRHFGGSVMHRLGVSQVAAYRSRPFGKPQIKLYDDAIGELHWFHQNNFDLFDRNSWLRGHDIVRQSDGKKFDNEYVISGVQHRYMDELQEFRDKVMECASRLFVSNDKTALEKK